MNDKEFYKTLKEKTSILANITTITIVLISIIGFIYKKTILSDRLIATIEAYVRPIGPLKSDLKKIEDTIPPSIIEFNDTIPINDIRMNFVLTIVNKSKKRYKSVEVPLYNFYSDPTLINKGYILYNDTLEYFVGKKFFKIDNILPGETYILNIFSNTITLSNNKQSPFSYIITEDESFPIRPMIKIMPENNFDEWLTRKIIQSKFLQVLIYIFSILGLYYIVKHVIPFIFSKIPTK